MQLEQRGKRRPTIRLPGCTVRCLRALAAAAMLIACTVETESRAAITIVEQSGRIVAGGRVTSFPANDPNVNDKRFELIQPVPPGIGSFTLNATAPPGALSVTGASAVANSTFNATITLDPLADSLVVSSVSKWSASSSVAGTPEFIALGGSSGDNAFALTFTLGAGFYEYEITGGAAFSPVVPDALLEVGEVASAFYSLELSNTSFSQVKTLLNRTVGQVNQGFSTGTLTPGTQYRVSTRMFGGAGLPPPGVQGIITGSVANSGESNFTLRVTPVGLERRWIDTGGGPFQGADNWSDPIVPGALDVAVFDRPGTYTVQLDQAVTNKRLRANGGGVNVTFDLGGNDYVLDEIRLGGLDGDNGSITFDDTGGPVVSAASAAASGDGLAAAANGAAANLRARLLRAGKGWTADVKTPISTTLGTIDFGGRVNVKGANGRWDVTLLAVGDEDVGTLVISADGNVVSDRAVLGEKSLPLAVGEVTVTGQGSTWDNQALIVGERSTGRLTIADKGRVTGTDIVIGSLPGSVGRITLQDTAELLENSTDKLTVGSSGFGTLEVKSNSGVEAGSLRIGSTSTANGTVTVESLGRIHVSNLLEIGGAGTGRLTVDGGSVLRSGSNFTTIGAKGTLSILDGLFHERSKLVVNGTLIVAGVTSSAFVGQSPDIRPGTVTVGPGGTIAGSGLIGGTLRVLPGGVDQFGGTVFTGNSPGTLTVEGDYEQLGGLLGIEIAGTAPGQFDVLAVTGSAILGGTLLLEFVDDFAPRQGDEFKFLDVGGALSGAFASIETRNLMPGFQFDLRPDAGGLTMVALNDGVFVPEPATLAMLVAGMLATLFRRHIR